VFQRLREGGKRRIAEASEPPQVADGPAPPGH
jgi:hypothetical protein